MTNIPPRVKCLPSSLIRPHVVSYNMHVSLSYAEFFPIHINYTLLVREPSNNYNY